jgi:hypothetical protein
MLRKLIPSTTLAVLFLAGALCARGQVAALKSFSGAINNRYAIKMSLLIEGTKISGSYYYVKVGKPITLRGSIDNSGKLSLEELDQTGNPTGVFKGRLASESEIVGTWSKPDGSDPMPFRVKAPAASDHVEDTASGVQIVSKRAVLTRGRKGSDYKEAAITYPIISGIGDAQVLAKLQKAISLKSVLDSSLEEYRAEFKESSWLDEISYEVNYNKDNLLDVTFSISGTAAYPSGSTKHVLVSLRTGDPVKAADAFKPGSLAALTQFVRKAFRASVEEAIKDQAKEGEDVKDLFSDKKYDQTNLDQFMVSDKGLTFLYDFDFPHVAKAAEPEGTYFFSFNDLKPFIRPDGPLGVFVR